MKSTTMTHATSAHARSGKACASGRRSLAKGRRAAGARERSATAGTGGPQPSEGDPCGAVAGDHGDSRRRACAPGERPSLYEEVTRRIIGELEQGRLPWVQPWGNGANAGPTLPRNARTGRAYSGINILILWGAVIAHRYPSQGWLTFRQALDAGGAVRKGEHGTTVVYADRFTPSQERERASASGERARSIAFLKRFIVFNVAQIDGLPDDFALDPAPLPEREIVPVGEAVIAGSGVDLRIGGSQAFYAPGEDYVQVPPQPAFFEQINYYRTCLHELTHATGHPSRLARDFSGRFGTQAYAREELIAEMGSAFLCASLGIVPTVRHADYLGSWLELLRDDLGEGAAGTTPQGLRGRAIFRAASAASKAADWLLARLADHQEPTNPAAEAMQAPTDGAIRAAVAA